ncbi:hypothetical protein ACFX1T_013382 [Malus domestica]
MDGDREANTRCTWFTQIGYVHGVEEFSLIVKGLHKYIDVASSLEVLFLHPGVVSLTDEDAQGLVKCDTKTYSRSSPSRRARRFAERGNRQVYKADSRI